MLKLHGLRTHCSRVWKQSDAWRLRGWLLRARFSKENLPLRLWANLERPRDSSDSFKGFVCRTIILVLMARFIVWFVYLQRSLLLKYSSVKIDKRRNPVRLLAT